MHWIHTRQLKRSFVAEGLRSLALRASSPCATYLSPSPDHFLVPLKPGALFCHCQTGYPTSCERQEGALLVAPVTKSVVLEPPGILLHHKNTPSSKMFPLYAAREEKCTHQNDNNNNLRIAWNFLNPRYTSNLPGPQQLPPIFLSLFWMGSPMLQWRQSRPPSAPVPVGVLVAWLINQTSGCEFGYQIPSSHTYESQTAAGPAGLLEGQYGQQYNVLQ